MLARLYRLLGLRPCDWCHRHRWCEETRLSRYLRRRCRGCRRIPGGCCTPVADAPVRLATPVLPGLPYAPSFLGDVRGFHTKRVGPGEFEGVKYAMERYSFSTTVPTEGEDLPDPAVHCKRLAEQAAALRAVVACNAMLANAGLDEVPAISPDYLIAAANQIRVRSGIRDTHFILLMNTRTAIKASLSPWWGETAGPLNGSGVPEWVEFPGCVYRFTVYIEDGLKVEEGVKVEDSVIVPIFPDSTAAVVAPFAWETWELEPTLDARPHPRDRAVQIALTDVFTVVEGIVGGTVLLRFPPVVPTPNPPGI